MKRKNFPHRKARRREVALNNMREWLEKLVSWRDDTARVSADQLERRISIALASIRGTERKLHAGANDFQRTEADR